MNQLLIFHCYWIVFCFCRTKYSHFIDSNLPRVYINTSVSKPSGEDQRFGNILNKELNNRQLLTREIVFQTFFSYSLSVQFKDNKSAFQLVQTKWSCTEMCESKVFTIALSEKECDEGQSLRCVYWIPHWPYSTYICSGIFKIQLNSLGDD
jgi:hypothetical protein